MSFSGVISSRFVSRLAGPVLIVVGLLGLSSCWVYSVEPLYEERSASPDPDLTFDQTLVGSWGQADEDCIWILTISAEEQRYALTMAPAPECKTSQKATAYEGHLVKVGSHRFLDVFPQSDEVCDLCLPLHSFLLVSQEADRLALIPVEHDWLWQAMQEQKVGLAHLSTRGTDDAIVLTASSAELKRFVGKYADDKAAFKQESDSGLRFKRR